MFVKKIKSEGLAHLSYLLGSEGMAAVIDPRLDVDVYIETAMLEGARIKYIFETHRNEDYVTGSLELAERTGARIFHGGALDFKYGEVVSEGDKFELGMLEMSVMETPGHTFESISIVVSDIESGGYPVGIFTGDALFVGDVGRTDFYLEKKEEAAQLLYGSVMEKILVLGDEILLYPAHGAGSACGSGMAQREFSTLGLERKNNPILRKSLKEFVQHKLSEHHYYPPYFRKMEEYNKRGAPVMKNIPVPSPVSADEFDKRLKQGMFAIDARSPEAYAGVHIPGSLAMPLDMIPAFAGWFLPYDIQLGIIVENESDIETAVRYLIRLGYDKINTVSVNGVHGWEASGRQYNSIPVVHVETLKRRIDNNEKFTLLDVRSREEFEKAHLPGAVNIFLGELPNNLGRLPEDRPLTAFCGSGRRAIIAASILENNGFSGVENCFGSMAACMGTSCGEIAE